MHPFVRPWMLMSKGSSAAAIAVLLSSAAAVPSYGQSIEDVVKATLANNPRVGIVASNREAIDQELRQARGLYLPQIDLGAGIGREYVSTQSVRAQTDGAEWLTRQESSLTLIQRVFDGFEADSEVARQKFRVESAAKRVYETSEFLGLDAIDAYLEVGRQRELRALAEENVKVHQEILNSLRQRAQRGAGSAADVAQTEGRLARARATLTQTVNDLRDGEARYTRIVGQPPENVARPTIPAAAMPGNLDAALDITAKNNPTIAIFDADVKVTTAEIDLAESRFYPKINIEAEGAYNDNRDGVESWDKSAAVMLRARWNLYRGGIDRANRREAVARQAEAKNRRYNSHIEAIEQMRRSWNAYEASRDRASQLRDAVRFNAQTRDAYRQQFNVAQRSLLDVLDAENELFVSRGQAVSAEYNLLASSYRILAVGGTLLQTLGVQAAAQSNPATRTFGQDIMN